MYKILVLDSNAQERDKLTRILTSAGYDVYLADTYSVAIQTIMESSPEIVITDWRMPDQDGIKLVELVRTLLGELEFIYIIVLTYKNDKRTLVEAFEAGVDDFLSKPIVVQELLARLKAGIRIIKLKHEHDRKCEQLLSMSLELRASNRINEKLATTDSLTGLKNRHEAMLRLKEAWAMSDRYGNNLSCLFLDIDNFKQFNDDHGHDIGDMVLKHIAQILKGVARQNEEVFRLGGEEFLVLCQMSDLNSAIQAGERLREAVQNQPLVLESQILNVTISVGAAIKSKRVGSFDGLIKEADQALYKAKAEGRNRVCT